MPDAAPPNPGNNKPLLAAPKPFAPEDEVSLREALKRCSPSAFESAVQYRKTGNPEHVPAVVIGIIERFVDHYSNLSSLNKKLCLSISSLFHLQV